MLDIKKLTSIVKAAVSPEFNKDFKSGSGWKCGSNTLMPLKAKKISIKMKRTYDVIVKNSLDP